ncbi:hypothetical protein IMZ29_06450 [Achromobacter sp. GG226]|uniref:PgaD family protein n=1 Tax=Verticiella alkaliphila TaxID=2779529 RepID=UPI001C0D16EB|nr:PgaD family protein [Verticiella sp. GG226]MBU4610188.1 hypothetical protein [Verticiella sp. GG226]
MRSLIIDASAAPFSDFMRRYGRTDGMLYAVWYRVARPAMVILMWVLFGLYVHHSLVTVGGTAAEIAELIVYVGVVASMAALLVSWMIIGGFHSWIRLRDMAETQALYEGDAPLNVADWPVPEQTQRVLVVHDDLGRIVAVEPWQATDAEPDPVLEIVHDGLPTVPSYLMRRTG